MPIYEYRRKTDGKIIEILQKSSEAPLTICPETGDPVEKLISASAFHLKGSGWYTTDYKSSTAVSAPSSDVAVATDKEVKTSTSAAAESESKPAPAPTAPKPEAKP